MVKPKITETDVSKLIPDPNNARKRTLLSASVIRKSLEQFGAARSIVIDENDVIRAGNGTYEEAGQLGIEKVLVVEADGNTIVAVKRRGLTEEQWKQYAIADNTASDFSTWDYEILEELASEVDLSEFFPDDKLNELLESLGKGEGFGNAEPKEEDEEEVAELLDKVDEIESRVKLGEIWQLGRHRISCGDSTIEGNVRALLGDRFDDVGMVFADVPYGINVVSKDGSLGGNTKGKYQQILGDETKDVAYNSFKLCNKLFKDNVLIFWGANHYASVVTDSSCWIIWDKQDGKSVDFADCELAWTNISQPARVFKHIWDGFRRDSERGEMRVHPTQKPVALCEWCFEKYGNDNDLIFDPFLGSAPSIIAAEKMEGDRTVYGFELSPAYCEVILRRFESLTGEVAKLVGHLPKQ